MKKFFIAIFTVCLLLFAAACKTSENKAETPSEVFYTPVIETEFEIAYGTVNAEIDLPKYVAHLNGEAIEAAAEMKNEKGETVDLTNGFIPRETGEYVYTISAEKNGAERRKEVRFYVEPNADDYENKIASFDKPYGVNHFRQATGISVSYSTDYKYENQAGSTKVSIDHGMGKELYFSLGNLHIKDLTDGKGLILYVYNDNPGHLNLYFNWTNSVTLMPNCWNKIYVNEVGLQALEKSYNALLADNFSLSSIDGLEIELGRLATSDCRYDLYFSAMYALEEDISVNIDGLKSMIDEFISSGDKTQAKIDEIEEIYASLTDEEKSLVSDYELFRNAVIDFYKSGAGIIGDKAVAFDEEIGVKQISEIAGATLNYSTLYQYGDEQGSAEINIYGFDAQLTIGYPFIEDIRRYDYMQIYFYNPTYIDYVLFNRIGGEDVTLRAKEWTEVKFELNKVDTLNDAVIWIYSGDWYKGLEYGVKIYMSAARMAYDGAFYQPAELVKLISGITGDTTLEELKELEKSYKKYTSEEKASVINHEKLVRAMYARLAEKYSVTSENTIVSFDSEMGIEQVTVEKAVGEFSTQEKPDGESGSTKFSVSGFDLLITLNYVPVIDRVCDSIEFGVYNDNDYDIVFFPNFFFGTEEVTIAPKQWTRVIITLNGNADCVGKTLWFYSGDWTKGIEGATIYLSEVKANYSDLQEKVIEFSSDNLPVETSNAALSYDPEHKFIGQKGALKAETKRDGQFFVDLTFTQDVDISEYSFLKLRIYCGYNGLEESGELNVAPRFLTTYGTLDASPKDYALLPSDWTSITIALADGAKSLKDVKIRIYPSGYGNFNGEVFYIADIEAVKQL